MDYKIRLTTFSFVKSFRVELCGYMQEHGTLRAVAFRIGVLCDVVFVAMIVQQVRTVSLTLVVTWQHFAYAQLRVRFACCVAIVVVLFAQISSFVLRV